MPTAVPAQVWRWIDQRHHTADKKCGHLDNTPCSKNGVPRKTVYLKMVLQSQHTLGISGRKRKLPLTEHNVLVVFLIVMQLNIEAKSCLRSNSETSNISTPKMC